ncbi:MAG: DoxX family protein [Cyclobacteriaceae bacterium]|nr:DoxX family protein [Cyclobacteriaceae bacterium]
MTNIYSGGQRFFLVALRIFIGWHFLYEGLLKLFNPGWSAKGYLLSAEGIFGSVFRWLGSDSMIQIVDVLTLVILIFVGLSLVLGYFAKIGALAGMAMLAFFYLSHPAFPGIDPGPAEGNYFIVNKNLIELVALGVVWCFPSSVYFGLEGLLKKEKE